MKNHPLSIFFALAAIVGLVMISPMSAEAKTVKKTTRRVCYKGFCPAAVSITKGADEKNFSNPVTRCLTKEITGMYEKAVSQMNADIKEHGDHPVEAEDYKRRLDITWDAMHEPYCGYGSYGLAAVKHSFDKSVTHARTEYLAEAK